MDMSFPEGVGGGFCPCSKVLIPEFSGAPSRDPGVGLCSISPMMKADDIISARSSEKKKIHRSEEETHLNHLSNVCRLLPFVSFPGTTADSPPSAQESQSETPVPSLTMSPLATHGMQIFVRI